MKVLVAGICVSLVLTLTPALGASQDEQANKLIVETVGLIKQADASQDIQERARLLTKADQNLKDVVAKYPGSTFAVLLATGQTVGNLSQSSVNKAAVRWRCTANPTRTCLFLWASELISRSYLTLRGLNLSRLAILYAATGDYAGANAVVRHH